MTKLIAIAVVEQQNRFLVGQRPPGVPLAGLFEFPGGKVEPAETAEAAAVRECEEETGLRVCIGDAYPDHTQVYDHGRVHLRFFRCSPLNPDDEPRPPYRWVDREELSLLEFPVGNRKLLALLLGE